jgi:hypothetical protein
VNNQQTPTERSFGILLLTACIALGLLGLYRDWPAALIAAWLLATGALGLVTVIRPQALRPLLRAWVWFGHTLGKVVSPIILGILYFGLLTPIALIARALGRDELKLKRRQVTSYWIERNPPGPEPGSFKNQF